MTNKRETDTSKQLRLIQRLRSQAEKHDEPRPSSAARWRKAHRDLLVFSEAMTPTVHEQPVPAGVQINMEGETAVIEGINGQWPCQTGESYVGAAGTAARFLPGLLAVGSGSWRKAEISG